MQHSGQLLRGIFCDLNISENALERILKTTLPNEPVPANLMVDYGCYRRLLEECWPMLEQIAHYEELILMKRARFSGLPFLRLSLVRNYIYARHPFYRPGCKAKEVRTIIGRTEVWGKDLVKLEKNNRLLSIARRSLEKAMDKHIEAKQNEFNKVTPISSRIAA